jgi:hypothetical protein
VARDAEVEGGEGYAPGSIEPVAVFEAFEEVTIRGEDIDIAEVVTAARVSIGALGCPRRCSLCRL